MAYATLDTLAALWALFPEPSGVSEVYLHDLHGSVTPPPPDALLVEVTSDTLRTCIATVPPLSTPRNDGWCVEHLISLVADQSCGEALATFTTIVIRRDVSNKITDLLSSETLVILLKKDADTMAVMKEALGVDYLRTQRPLGMGSTLVKIASNCALLLLRGSLGVAVEPSQFSVETKKGYDLIQWALQMAMESNGSLSIACLDGFNAFGKIERDCIRAALEASPELQNMVYLALFCT